VRPQSWLGSLARTNRKSTMTLPNGSTVTMRARPAARSGKRFPGWTIWNGEVPGGETAEQVAARLDRVVARVRESGVDQAICFGHGHALRALTMRWLAFDFKLGVHFPLDTGTVSVLGEDRAEPALERWNARP
jgi:broad specificity phosphatase PhoE